MSFPEWFSLLSICLLGAASPGPSLALVIRYTLISKAAGLRVALFHGLAIGCYAVLVVIGLGALIAQSPLLFRGLQLAGAAYLVWLGVQLLRTTATPSGEKVEQGSAEHALRDAFIIAFANPKIALWFLALFSQFISVQHSNIAYLQMVLTVGGVDALWYSLVALLLARSRLLDWLRHHPEAMDRLMGTIFLLLAARTVLL